MYASLCGALGLVVLLAACGSQGTAPVAAGAGTQAAPAAATGKAAVNAARIVAADGEPGNWMTYGRTYDEQRFSPLQKINAQNVSQLKLAWHYDLDAAHRVQESTPIVVDGVMYLTSAWSKVFALDPATGKELWVFDPAVPGTTGVKGCCDVANRGVAVWNGKVYVGTFDGRLIALDAATGKPVWSVSTVDTPGADPQSYTITGAPRIVKGKVIIGNAGGEYRARGYLTAYDAETGKKVWRFYTVPGEPGKADGAASDEVLESKARSTWNGEFWKLGGGGTTWDGMAYDPKLDLLYFGTDNGEPWNHAVRGGGDNLFTASIVAVRPDTGQYVWHFQNTPGESWDYSAVQQMTLADLTLDGKVRRVIMQAPKNGYFYVLDRATGEFISAQPYTQTNWAKGLDPKTGRPLENPAARYGETGKPWTSMPGPSGGHSWQAMSYDPLTHLVYVPVIDGGFVFIGDKSFKPKVQGWNTAVDFNAGSLPEDPKVIAQIKSTLKGHLSAWDPVAQKQVWSVPYATSWNGGVVSTAGNLVFEGTSMGEFAAFQADDGKRLWSTQTYTGIVAPPITYEANGEQYVVVEVGWGGAFGLAAGQLAHDAQPNQGNIPRVLAFKLNGTDTMPAGMPAPDSQAPSPPNEASAKVVAQGKLRYHTYCSMCHGDSAFGGGVLPDLRHSVALSDPGLWQSIVHDGARSANGMVSFGGEMGKDEIETIRAYVIYRANQTKNGVQ
ncbi:MAG TPA: PQQ-dependent dehydrogenase, methanol/ethanol family [Steroidobacteraceae bacterium]